MARGCHRTSSSNYVHPKQTSFCSRISIRLNNRIYSLQLDHCKKSWLTLQRHQCSRWKTDGIMIKISSYKVFGLHPHWKDLSLGIKSAFNYPLTSISSKDRKLDLHEAIIYGNHKGVDKHRDVYLNLIRKDLYTIIVFLFHCQ